jgi:hypothetical protein
MDEARLVESLAGEPVRKPRRRVDLADDRA